MKLITLISVVLSLLSCSNYVDLASSLYSMQDHQYVLKLSKTASSEELYSFQVCLQQIIEERCVDALKSDQGKPVLFSSPTLSELTLSEEEKNHLIQSHLSWHHYQRALERRKTGRLLATGISLGGAVGMTGLAIDLTHQARMVSAHNRLYFEASKKALRSAATPLVKALQKRALNPDQINKMAAIQAKETIFSSAFINHFHDQAHTDVGGALNALQENTLLHPHPSSSIDQIPYEKVVRSFLAQNHKATDIIEDIFLEDYFKEGKRLAEKKLGSSGSPTKIHPQGFVQSSDQFFARNRGELETLLRAYPKEALQGISFVSQVQYLLARTTMMLQSVHINPKIESGLDQIKEEISKRRSAKHQLKKSKIIFKRTLKRSGYLTLGVGGAVAGIIAVSTLGLSKAERDAEALEEDYHRLYMILGEGSNLDTQDVSSISKSLKLLAHWYNQQKTLQTAASLYCLPEAFAKEILGTKCYAL